MGKFKLNIDKMAALYELHISLGFTRTELAKAANISQQTLSHYFNKAERQGLNWLKRRNHVKAV